MGTSSRIVIYGNDSCTYLCRSANAPDPQIFVDSMLVDGFKKPGALANSGALDKLLVDNVVREL